MSGTVSVRFYFPDWISESGLRVSSLAARGLWMDLLCHAAGNKGKDYGFVIIGGNIPTMTGIARLVGALELEIVPLLDELERNGVFSRDRRGAIYCRRMVRAEKSRSNGRFGGNPILLKAKENQKLVNSEANPLIPVPVPVPDPVREIPTESPPAAKKPPDDFPANAFELFWKNYPPGRKTGKGAAQRKFDAIRKSRKVTFATLMNGVMRYAGANPDPQYTKAPEVWLNKGCWDDESYGGRNGKTANPDDSKIGFAGFAARLRQSQRNRAAPPEHGSATDPEPFDGR